MFKRVIALMAAITICAISIVFPSFSVPVSAASGGGITLLYDLYQLYYMLMGVTTSSSQSDYGFDDYWHDNFVHEDYYPEYDQNLTEYEYGAYGLFDILHIDDLITNYDKWTGSWTESFDTVGSVGSGVVIPDTVGGNLYADSTIYRFLYPSGKTFYSSDKKSSISFYPSASSSPSSYFLYWGILSDGRFIIADNSLSMFTYYTSGRNNQARAYTQYARTSYYYTVLDTTTSSVFLSVLSNNGVNISKSDCSTPSEWMAKFVIADFSVPTAGDSDFIGPVYSYPAAEQLAKDNDTLTGIRLAVDTPDGIADISNVLDKTGCDDMDDVAAGVAAGTIPMTDVFSAAGVTPYILTDVNTGAIITDMGVSATDAGVKPVGLSQDLSIPADVTIAEELDIPGKTYDPDIAKYKLPLFQYFPFCLPYDIYRVLDSFDAEPVAPVIDIPLGSLFSGLSSFKYDSDYVATVDLGDKNYSKWFSLLRLLEKIGILIGIVLIARMLIHGGN